jgi:hypothetical protein
VLFRYATYARAAAADDAARPGTGPESALIEPTWISESVTPGASDGAVHGADPPDEAAGSDPDAAGPPTEAALGCPEARLPSVAGPVAVVGDPELAAAAAPAPLVAACPLFA